MLLGARPSSSVFTPTPSLHVRQHLREEQCAFCTFEVVLPLSIAGQEAAVVGVNLPTLQRVKEVGG